MEVYLSDAEYTYKMSTADYPQTDVQTKRVNRVVKYILRSVCADAPKRWSFLLPVVEFGGPRLMPFQLTSTLCRRSVGNQTAQHRAIQAMIDCTCGGKDKCTKQCFVADEIAFALNNFVHASNGYTPFFVNDLTHPCDLTLPRDGLGLDGKKFPIG